MRWVYPASDGHVVVSLLFGPMGGPFTRRLIEWMHAEGLCRDSTLDRDYVEFASKIQQGEYTLGELDEIMDEIEAFTATRTKGELAAGAAERSRLAAAIPVPTASSSSEPFLRLPPTATVGERRQNGDAGSDKPLAGIKVLDLAWVAAMPLATRVLAHWGRRW